LKASMLESEWDRRRRRRGLDKGERGCVRRGYRGPQAVLALSRQL